MTRRSALRPRTFARDRIAWALLLLGCVAGGMGAYSWGHRRVFDPQVLQRLMREPRIEDTRFVVLVYDRTMVTAAGGLDQAGARLADHLRALRAAGFQPMTLGMLERFLWQGLPLPRRAVLLTFDHGHLATFEAVDPVLRAMGWPAVMLVATSQIEDRDPAFLYWDRLDKMVASGIWELGSLGDESERMIPIDREGDLGDFAVHRRWLRRAHRLETAAEFDARLKAHYEEALNAFENELPGTRVAAFGFRHREAFPDDAGLRADARRILAAHHSVAFVEDVFGVNDVLADPYQVKRLRVPTSWDGYELVQRLEATCASRPVGPASVVDPLGWRRRSGTLIPGLQGFTLEGEPRADAWLAGSTSHQEWRLDLDVQPAGGQFWISQTSTEGAAEWRLGGDGSGVAVQIRTDDRAFETLARVPDLHLRPGHTQHLTIVKRGAGVWASWDGQPIFGRPIDLPGRWRGPLACVSWKAGGPVRVSDVRYGSVPYQLAAASAQPGQGEVQELLGRAATVAAVAPLWLTSSGSGWEERARDRMLWRVLERRAAWEIVPRAVLSRASGLDGAAGDTLWASLITRARVSGLRSVVLDTRDLAPLVRRRVALRVSAYLHSLPWQQRREALAEVQRRASMAADGFIYLPLGQVAAR